MPLEIYLLAAAVLVLCIIAITKRARLFFLSIFVILIGLVFITLGTSATKVGKDMTTIFAFYAAGVIYLLIGPVGIFFYYKKERRSAI